jgi:Short C-terminal domain
VFGRDKKLEERLREHGCRAQAVVLEAESGVGVTVGNPALGRQHRGRLELKLQVQPEGEPEFTADVKARFPQFGGPRQGTPLSVLYDPDDHSKILVDQSTEGYVQAALEGAVATSPALSANPALPGSLGDLMQQALADPAAFQQKMREQAAAGIDPLTGQSFAQPAPAQAAAADPVDQLEKLADLRDRGVLTPEEFEAQKRRILGE